MKNLLANLIHARDPNIMLDAIYRLDRWELGEWMDKQPHITHAAAREIKQRLDCSDELSRTTYHIQGDELWFQFTSSYENETSNSQYLVTKIIP